MPRNRSKSSAAGQWLRAAAVAASLLSGPAVLAQTSGNAAGTTEVVPANARAQMWAATARFVYTDDPALKPIQAELLKTIQDKSISAFNQGVDAAVVLEKQKLGAQQRVLKFRGVVSTIQDKVNPSDYGGLAQAIVAELQKNPERMADLERKSSLTALSRQLNQLATGTATTAAEAADTAPTIADVTEVAATPAQDSGADAYEVPEGQLQPEAQTDIPTSTPAPAMPDSATPPLLWAALLMSGLSLLGVLYLLLTRSKSGGRQRSSSYDASTYDSESARTSTQRQQSFSQDGRLSNAQLMEVREVVYKALNEAKSPSTAPAAPAPKQKQAPKPPTRQAQPQAAAPAPVVPPQQAVYAAPEPDQTDHLFAVEAPAAPAPAEPAAPRVHVIYANQQPINGAFLRDNLADAPASYTIFEIMVDERTPDQGTFVVTRNESGHGGYIGSHMSILEPACTYNYPTGPVSRIITETPGTVQRTPSGDWRINQKARIYFV
ncbi:hypothetical protein MTX78_18875 [Hymenobacter tibetensis]|uniref:Uncharacterized protein n=1 Tax=Hymenobacter tibetensis TaxID=497967 RepID=A0ABY4CWM9_9BACT|nr:hypothetical protein [Hymenobacter tibetensis]UOG74172.1 hypothetical protein MTX78_18875 [Hymenobacter tibetensis]